MLRGQEVPAIDPLVRVPYSRRSSDGGGLAVNEDENNDFAYTELTPVRRPLYRDDFRMFLVQVKSETEAGRELHNDPIDFFRRNIPELVEGEDDVKAMVLRVNAERSANPKHRSEVWLSYPSGSKTVVGIQYKYDRDMLAPGGEEAAS
jgi:hypothetical protein